MSLLIRRPYRTGTHPRVELTAGSGGTERLNILPKITQRWAGPALATSCLVSSLALSAALEGGCYRSHFTDEQVQHLLRQPLSFPAGGWGWTWRPDTHACALPTAPTAGGHGPLGPGLPETCSRSVSVGLRPRWAHQEGPHCLGRCRERRGNRLKQERLQVPPLLSSSQGEQVIFVGWEWAEVPFRETKWTGSPRL